MSTDQLNPEELKEIWKTYRQVKEFNLISAIGRKSHLEVYFQPGIQVSHKSRDEHMVVIDNSRWALMAILRITRFCYCDPCKIGIVRAVLNETLDVELVKKWRESTHQI